MKNWRTTTIAERLAHLVSLYDTSPGRGGQSAIAKLTKGKIRQSTISTVLNGSPEASMAVDTAVHICEATGADLVWLCTGVGSPPDEPRAMSASPNGIQLPDSIPVSQRAHLVDLIQSLARRDPLTVEFIDADMDAVAEGKVNNVALDAHLRGGLISSFGQRQTGKSKVEASQNALPTGHKNRR